MKSTSSSIETLDELLYRFYSLYANSTITVNEAIKALRIQDAVLAKELEKIVIAVHKDQELEQTINRVVNYNNDINVINHNYELLTSKSSVFVLQDTIEKIADIIKKKNSERYKDVHKKRVKRGLAGLGATALIGLSSTGCGFKDGYSSWLLTSCASCYTEVPRTEMDMNGTYRIDYDMVSLYQSRTQATISIPKAMLRQGTSTFPFLQSTSDGDVYTGGFVNNGVTDSTKTSETNQDHDAIVADNSGQMYKIEQDRETIQFKDLDNETNEYIIRYWISAKDVLKLPEYKEYYVELFGGKVMSKYIDQLDSSQDGFVDTEEVINETEESAKIDESIDVIEFIKIMVNNPEDLPDVDKDTLCSILASLEPTLVEYKNAGGSISELTYDKDLSTAISSAENSDKNYVQLLSQFTEGQPVTGDSIKDYFLLCSLLANEPSPSNARLYTEYNGTTIGDLINIIRNGYPDGITGKYNIEDAPINGYLTAARSKLNESLIHN